MTDNIFHAYIHSPQAGGLVLAPIDPRMFRRDGAGTGGGITRNAIFGERFIALTGTADIPNYNVPRTRVHWRITSLTFNTLQLLPVAEAIQACELEVTLLGTMGLNGIIRPRAGENLDGIDDNVAYVARVGDTVIFRKVLNSATGTYGWVSTNNTLSTARVLATVTSDPNLTTGQLSSGWRGLMSWRCVYAAAGVFRLPAGPMEGTHARIFQTAESEAVTLNSAAIPIVSGGTSGTMLALVDNAPVDLVFSGGIWIAAA